MTDNDADRRAERASELEVLWLHAYDLGFRHGKAISEQSSYHMYEAERRRASDIREALRAEGLDDA